MFHRRYRIGRNHGTRALNDRFVLNTLKTLSGLSRVLLDLSKCILSGTIKFVSVWLSQRNLSFFEFSRLQYYFLESFRCNLTFYKSEDFSDSSLVLIFESENCRFPFSTKTSRLTWRVKCEKINFRKWQDINQISFENCT